MLKCVTRLFQVPLRKLIFYAIWLIIIVHFFTYYGYSNHSNITREELVSILHKVLNPNLKPLSQVACRYDFIRSTATLRPQDLPHKFDNFSAEGIVNGSYFPKHCRPLFSVAVLVTYRNRQKQLDIFVPYIHNFLRKQNIHYKLFVIEQQDNLPWNKGLLYNTGARAAIAEGFPCLVLQDVDLLPLDTANLYACLPQPRHLSVAIDKFRFVLPYKKLVGGVTSIRADQYVQVNGFSNSFLGWGGEDDDFANRLEQHHLTILRTPADMSRYSMLQHPQEPRNPLRARLLGGSAGSGGYSSPRASSRLRPTRLYTLLRVQALGPPR